MWGGGVTLTSLSLCWASFLVSCASAALHLASSLARLASFLVSFA